MSREHFSMYFFKKNLTSAILRTQWNKTDKNSYWTMNENTKFSELMGYKQSYKELTFVTVRNAGHMVPKDQPKWSLQILKDFIKGTCYDKR